MSMSACPYHISNNVRIIKSNKPVHVNNTVQWLLNRKRHTYITQGTQILKSGPFCWNLLRKGLIPFRKKWKTKMSQNNQSASMQLHMYVDTPKKDITWEN